MKRIGNIERRKAIVKGKLFYEEWKLVRRYPYKIASQRDQRRTHTASDK